jgi:hypothetical protein
VTADGCPGAAPEKTSRRNPAPSITSTPLPLIEGAQIEGAYVATSTAFKILNAPATGEALAERIVDGAARST